MKFIPFIPLVLTVASLSGAQAKCAPDHPVPCNEDSCCRTYCLGPDNYGINAPVAPYTCNGDFNIMVSGLYWRATQTGLEYAVRSNTIPGNDITTFSDLIHAKYESPHFDWNFGFKIGIGYTFTCDAWDLQGIWTRYEGNSTSRVEAEPDDNQTLFTLWSNDNAGDPGKAHFARDIRTDWGVKLNLVDIELGRRYWNSPRIALRPHIGLRVSYIDQSYDIYHLGGVLTFNPMVLITPSNNEVRLKNDFKGVGIRVGLNGDWNVGCGFGLYGDFALSLNTGKFSFDHTEANRAAESPFSKTRVLEEENFIRATRLFTDMGIAMQYSTLLSNCNYALTASFGYEQHLFLDMNQMWRVTPKENDSLGRNNIYHQRRGDLSTQGWTLKLALDF